MSNLVRTSITIPEDVYKQARILAATSGRSFSSFVARALESNVKGKKNVKKSTNPFNTVGVFSLRVKKIYNKRSDLYDKHIKRKMGV